MLKFTNALPIWHNDCSGANRYADFFASFEGKADTTVRIACDGNYSLYINGVLAGFGQYPGYPDLRFADEYCIGEFVRSGVNTLKIVVHHPGQSFSTYRVGKPFVIFELESDGEVVCASSAETLTCVDPNYTQGISVGLVSYQQGFTFGLDLTAEVPELVPAVLVDGEFEFNPRPIDKLVTYPEVPTKIIVRGVFTDTLQNDTAAKIMYSSSLETRALVGAYELPNDGGIKLDYKGGDGCFAVVDIGAENTGILSLDIEVAEDCDIMVGWGEHLADLRVRTSIDIRSFAAKIRLKAGRNRIVNPLIRLGLRYLELHIYSRAARIYYAGIKPTLYPLAAPTKSPIDDRLHSMIYDTCVRTLHLCMHEHYEDCPWREQALYSMDSRNQMLCGYRVFGETRFARASIELMAHSIREDDMLELCSPAEVPITIPAFSAIFLTQLCEYLDFSGDEEFVRRILPTAKRIAAAFIAKIEDNRIIRAFEEKKYWNFYEWSHRLGGNDEERGSYDAPLGAFVAMGLDSLASICDRLDAADAEIYRTESARLKEGLQAFYDEQMGCYATFLRDGKRSHYCELTNALMLCAGAVPEEKRTSVRKKLMSGELIEVTLSHSIFKYEALLDDPDNVDYVLGDIAEKWGYMLREGATTFWETIDGESAFSNAGSLCHGWSAIPAHIYFRIAAM